VEGSLFITVMSIATSLRMTNIRGWASSVAARLKPCPPEELQIPLPLCGIGMTSEESTAGSAVPRDICDILSM
jgi:hypothetical protein